MTEGKAHTMSHAHVRAGLPRARRAEAELAVVLAAGETVATRGTAGTLRRELEECGQPHSPEAHEVIAGELVACSLGARRRPELERGSLGVQLAELSRAASGLREQVLAPFARLAAKLAALEAEQQQRLHDRAARVDP